jgi:hypothetical protein
MDADVWLFIKWVAGHGTKAVERFHRPLAYFLAGDALRLAACLDTFQSELTAQIKSELRRRNIDWRTSAGIKQFSRLLQRVNNRISRSMGKTVSGLDVILWATSRDPNLSVGIASKSDPYAQEKMCVAIGKLMEQDAYQMYYGDRLNPKADWITKKWIRMVGRTVHDQESIEARGINSQWTGNHYDWIYADDIVGTESGEASTDDAKTWIAAIHGISKQEGLGGTRHIFNGTIYGPKDDNAVLIASGEFLSTRVPVWTKSVPSTVANIKVDGEPTLPEWTTKDDICRKRKETLAGETQGAISWLQNFELTAHEEGAMQFTAELLRKSKFVWAENSLTKKREIRRYLWTAKGEPKINPGLARRGDDCLCYREDCHDPKHEFVQFDPLSLPRTMGVDQSLQVGRDHWGIGCTAIDPWGFRYILKGRYENGGYWTMVPAIALVFNAWGGIDNPVSTIAMESNVWQSMSTDWIKRSPELQFLARRIQKLPPTQTAKVIRIFNDVYANLQMGTLLTDPEDTIFDACALKYNGAEPDTQWDDPLDCVAMSIQAHKTSASDITDKEMEAFARNQQRDFDENYRYGVDVSTDFTDYLWN